MMDFIRVNNEAALLIEHGKYKKAIQLLRTVNQNLVTFMEKKHLDRVDNDLHSSQAKPIINFDCIGNSRKIVEEEMSSSPQHSYFCEATKKFSSRQGLGTTTGSTVSMTVQQESYHANDHEPFIYRRPIRITRLPLEREDFCLSVIILFNLGLAYQLMARHLKETHMMIRSRLFRVSLHFYQSAFVMKHQGRLHFDTCFVLAMLNNTLHLQSNLGREYKAKMLQELILSTLMMVVDNNLTNSIDDMEGFMATATQSMKTNEVSSTAWAA